MRRRRTIAVLAVLALAITAGCLGPTVSEEELAEDATYNWDTDVDAEIVLEEGGLLGGDEFRGVYRIENQSEIQLYRRGFTRDHALHIRAVQFRHPNGTVVGHEEIDVETSQQRTTVHLPAEHGQFAFTADRRTQQLSIPAYVEGSHRVILPPGHRVGDFLLSDVVPRNAETEVVNDRMSLTWEEVDNRLIVRYYLDRDQTLFWGLVAILSVAGIGIYLYYSREIRRIAEWRKEQGLDVDYDEDDRDRPPPGMG